MEICRNVQVLHPAAEGILCGRSFLYLFRIFRGRNNKDMEEKKNILTYAGLKKYEDELHSLKVERRQEVAQKIKEAMEQGDLSENAEYDAAKDEQRDIEARIEELEKMRKNVEVVIGEDVALDRISVG